MLIRLATMKRMDRTYDWQVDGEADAPADNCGSEKGFCFLEGNFAQMCRNP